MSLPLAFGSNLSKWYQQSGNFKTKEISSNDLVIREIYTSEGEFFKVELADPFEKYELPRVNTDKIVNSWNSDPLKFYQNQLNFVMWCSTTRCGVSYEYLSHSNSMINIFFLFYVYYQIRRLLEKMSCPAFFLNFWSAFENTHDIDIAAYRKICRDFHISPVSNWRQRVHVDVNSTGLGIAYYYDNGYVSVPGKDYDNSSLGIPFSNGNNYSNTTKMGFGDHLLTYIYGRLHFPISPGCAGLGLYVYALLGAQAQAQTRFLVPGTGLEAKREFLNILEACIDSPVNLRHEFAYRYMYLRRL